MKRGEPIMFRRITAKLDPEHGDAAYVVQEGDMVAVGLERAGALDHERAEFTPRIYSLRPGGAERLGYNYDALLDASRDTGRLESDRAEYRCKPEDLRDYALLVDLLAKEIGNNWRWVRVSGTGWPKHRAKRREDAERLSRMARAALEKGRAL